MDRIMTEFIDKHFDDMAADLAELIAVPSESDDKEKVREALKKGITGSALISLISSKSTRCSAKERSARSQLTWSRNFIRRSTISASRRTRRSQDSSGVA